MGELLIDTGGQIKKMSNVMKADAPKIAAIISDLLLKPAVQASAPAPAAEKDIISQLERLAALKEKGILTDDEFAQQKAKILESARA